MSNTHEFGKEQSAEFMALLGTCITEWAWIEEETYQVCAIVLGTAAEHTSIIYYRTPSLEARLNLADELMSTIFPKPETGKHPHFDAGIWSKLILNIKDAMPLRNQLAHSPTAAGIWGMMDDETGEISEVVEIKMQNSPHAHEMWRPNKPKKKMLLKEDLERHLTDVRSLHERLQAFRRDVLPGHVARLFPQHGRR
jgi:hypothetical protein